ncbi:MAG: hypothetical protein HY042_11255 [Spirochaetia bacterium]|nr:hypothetical protein [Spirochaetia bacterium]
MKLVQKLLIKPQSKVLLLNSPSGFKSTLVPLPPGASLAGPEARECDAVILFVSSTADLDKLGPEALLALKFDGLFWVAYPKNSSGVETDLGRDQGWEYLERQGFEGVALVAIDDVWSAMRFRPFARKDRPVHMRAATGADRKAMVLAQAAKRKADAARKSGKKTPKRALPALAGKKTSSKTKKSSSKKKKTSPKNKSLPRGRGAKPRAPKAKKKRAGQRR